MKKLAVKIWYRRLIVASLLFAGAAALGTVATCSGDGGTPVDGGTVAPAAPRIAFMADVHLQDVYARLGDFAGVPNSKSQKNATIRTMYAQLTSTRLFNENYFAFRAALADAFDRGVRYVALPGDYTDDGQPHNLSGLRAILEEYRNKGMRFFLAPGNHDPNEPFERGGQKDDFLGASGQNQRLYSVDNGPCKGTTLGHLPDKQHPAGPDIVCTDEMKESGYAEIINQLADYGYMPSPEDLYWESPFSSRGTAQTYDYSSARKQADLGNRQFEICNEGEGGKYKLPGYSSCAFIADASYLVEPVKGVWLVAIDANVYQPKARPDFDPDHPEQPGNYSSSGDAGYNYVLTHKKHLVEWLTDVSRRAKVQGKTLITFSHFPMSEFFNGQSDAMVSVFKPGAFQMARRPLAETTRALAATGVQLHIGGHMHFNNTGIYQSGGSEDGAFLVNIQSPSLGVFGAAYKLVTLHNDSTAEVETIALDNVPRFDELFEHYETEWQRLQKSTAPEDSGHLWKHEILDAKSFHDFTRFYFGELSRLRFLNDYWPCTLKEAAQSLNGAQLLTLSQLKTQVTLAQLKDVADVVPITAGCAAVGTPSGTPADPSQLRQDWATATAKATALAAAAGFTLADFAKLSPYEFYGDFHRTVYAGELALRDMGAERVKQYKVLMAAFPVSPTPIVKVGDQPSDQNPVHVVFQREFKAVFSILQALGSGNPSDHFVIDFKKQTVISNVPNALSFR